MGEGQVIMLYQEHFDYESNNTMLRMCWSPSSSKWSIYSSSRSIGLRITSVRNGGGIGLFVMAVL